MAGSTIGSKLGSITHINKGVKTFNGLKKFQMFQLPILVPILKSTQPKKCDKIDDLICCYPQYLADIKEEKIARYAPF